MFSNSDLKILYKDDRAKQYCRIKWVLTLGIFATIAASIIYYFLYNSQPIEQQITQTVLFMNKLTFMGIVFSVIISVLMVICFHFEKMCVDIVIDSRHSSLKQKVRTCLAIDRRERKEKGGMTNVM